MERAKEHNSLKFFFEPKSVAVIGASRNPLKFGYSLLKNLIDLGFKGNIYPVNPNAEEILGLKVYPQVNTIEEDLDLAIIIVPAFKVPQIMWDCAKKHVKGAVICSSGFREAGENGAKLEDEIVAIAKEAGIRIIGPNTTGILNTSNNFTSSFVPLPKFKRGNVAFVAQTGLFAAAAFWWIISKQPFGVSKIVGLGNKCDVDDAEILEHLADDEDTEVIAIYMEGVKDGRRLFKAFREVSKVKPIIVLKSGRSPAGIKASMSHTGSIAVRDEIFNAICKQSGVIRVEGDLDELLDITKAFALQPLPKGNRVAVVTITGGGGVIAADKCSEYGLELDQLSNETIKRIKERMPLWATVSNPIDIEPLFESVGPEESVKMAVESVLEDENVDSVIIIFVAVPRIVPHFEIKRIITYLKDKNIAQKPMLTYILGYKEIVDMWTAQLEEEKIPVYSSIERCVKSLASLWKYKAYRMREK